VASEPCGISSESGIVTVVGSEPSELIDLIQLASSSVQRLKAEQLLFAGSRTATKPAAVMSVSIAGRQGYIMVGSPYLKRSPFGGFFILLNALLKLFNVIGTTYLVIFLSLIS